VRDNILDLVLESIAEGVYTVDRENRITYWNKGAERITGYPREGVIGTQCSDKLLKRLDGSGKNLCLEGCPLSESMDDRHQKEVEAFLHHRDGHRVPVLVKAIPIADAEGRPIGSIEIFSDRSERSRLLSELESLRKETLADPLTGLGNRRYADLSIERCIERFRREKAPFGILILDIDHFKKVNDEYGHPNGDRMLRMVGWTLANAVRRLDSAARWGGEEFLVVAPGVDEDCLAEIAERARILVMRSRVSVEGGRQVAVTASIGGAVVMETDDKDSLIARADERLYECKAAGRNRTLVKR
jgi:diguanylate cyclase (GGDEF)-like protein/PAS domain S-box-containing protein